MFHLSDIQEIIDAFIAAWQEREDYSGVLLTGSFATQTADKGSDIDLRILYTSDSDYYEVGDCTIGGKSVSFVGMSKEAYERTFQEDLATISKFEIRRIAVGQILEDKFGDFEKLKSQAENLLQNVAISGFEPRDLLSEQLQLNRKIRVLGEMPTDDVFFPMAYFDLLKSIFQFYAKYLQADIPVFLKKWSRFLTNANYRQANYFTEFPDEKFISIFIETAQNIDIQKITKVYQYVIEKSGGLKETDFMVRFYDNQPDAELFELG